MLPITKNHGKPATTGTAPQKQLEKQSPRGQAWCKQWSDSFLQF